MDFKSNITQVNLDVERYMGKWHEFAKIPFMWEKDCIGATADYYFNSLSNTISVTNTCIKLGGETRSRSAIAILTSESGKLLLNFNDGLPANVGYQPYWVHWTDYDNFAIVGGPSKEMLWILTRNEKVNVEHATMLKYLVSYFGYDVNKVKIN